MNSEKAEIESKNLTKESNSVDVVKKKRVRRKKRTENS
jgi:hypothetical protein